MLLKIFDLIIDYPVDVVFVREVSKISQEMLIVRIADNYLKKLPADGILPQFESGKYRKSLDI